MNRRLAPIIGLLVFAISLGACTHRYPIATLGEQRITVTEPPRPQPRMLVLSPVADDKDTVDKNTEVFFATFCNWVSTNREAVELYPVVLLLAKRDSIQGALTDLDTALASLPKSTDGTQSFGTIAAKSAVDKIKLKIKSDLSKAHRYAYSCATKSTKDALPVTLVTASYVNVPPYGPGMEYQVLAPDQNQRRDFFRLSDPTSRNDARLFALRVLPDPTQQFVIQQTAAVSDHDECTPSASSLACIYQDATARIEVAAHDSLLLRGNEIEFQPWDRWEITRDDEPADQEVTIESPKNEPGNLRGIVHFKQPGHFVFRGTASAAHAPDVAKRLNFAIDVQLRAVVLEKRSYGDDARDLKDERTHGQVRLRRDVTYRCFSVIWSCLRGDASLEKRVTESAADARALSPTELIRLLSSLRDKLAELPSPYARPNLVDAWNTLLRRRVDIDAGRKLLESPDLEPVPTLVEQLEIGGLPLQYWNEFHWCGTVIAAIVHSMPVSYPDGYNAVKGAHWVGSCLRAARTYRSSASEHAKGVVVSNVEAVSGDDVLSLTNEHFALDLNEQGYFYYRGAYPEGTGTIAVRSHLADGVPVEPILVATHVQGVRPPVGIGLIGVYRSDVRRPTTGVRIELWPLEVLSLSADVDVTPERKARLGVRASLAPICFLPSFSEACRRIPIGIDGSIDRGDTLGNTFRWGGWLGFGQRVHLRLGVDVHGTGQIEPWIYVARQLQP